MKQKKYCDLKNGDLFKICLSSEKVQTPYGKENDLRWYKKTQDGALEVVDVYGRPCEADGFKCYPYYDMPVWVEENVQSIYPIPKAVWLKDGEKLPWIKD